MQYLILLFIVLFTSCLSSTELKKEKISGLKEPVEVIRDKWGINHIYAKNQHDLFFAQGYAAARDRLFQFEMWRRQATGTVAEILGEHERDRDIGARLFKFRGDLTTELNHYHEDGKEIITAFTHGVNAYIEEILRTPDSLPIEFKILDILPGKWTPEVVISRHQGLLQNVTEELLIGRSVAKLGVKKTKDLHWFHPHDPEIELDESIDKELLFDDILYLYKAFRKPINFQINDVGLDYRNDRYLSASKNPLEEVIVEDKFSVGSNNWVTSGELMADGHTYMACDPHRAVTVPSLRYMAHLVAPGWDVIGGGEPTIPGISIGHNEYGAWGLTIFRTDAEDLYVYDLNPTNRKQYLYKGKWEDMDVLTDTIHIKDKESTTVDLAYSRHGPVVYVDSLHNKAYAVRCGWLEVGGAPYLASLRMGQTKTWEEFREACSYSNIPGENMIWADREGNIGWQAVGITPIRPNFSGLVPVPGDGRYEWAGYLPIKERPHAFNPEKGFVATANQNIIPQDYVHMNAVGYSWADPFRGDRINEVLRGGTKFTMDDMRELQVDYLSIPARQLIPLLMKLPFDGKSAEAKNRLANWDYKLLPGSIEAAIYVALENEIKRRSVEQFVPASAKGIIESIQLGKIISWLLNPDSRFGTNPDQGRDDFLVKAFDNAVANLEQKLGEDMNHWQYGQEKFKHTYLEHPLSKLVNSNTRDKLDLGPLPRGGNGYTVGATGNNDKQNHGALFKIIVNTGDWDATIATSGPGQSGDPESPFYSNLFDSWAKDEYFPVYYSRNKIESVAASKEILAPTERL